MSFDLLDLTSVDIDTLPLVLGYVGSRATPHITTPPGKFVMMSDDEQETSFYIPLNVPQRFTFETTLLASSLPRNLGDLSKSAMFIAVFDQQDNVGGLLLSQEGLAVVSAVGNTVMPIVGSHQVFSEGSYYTIRMVVDGSKNIMDIYITPEADVAVSGHKLQYTSVAPNSPEAAIDSVRMEVWGQPERPIVLELKSLRLSSALSVPNKRPIASAGQDQTASLQAIVKMNGAASYDPEGEQLGYTWSVVGVPKGSQYQLTGTGATATDSGGDGYASFLEAPAGTWSKKNAPLLQPGDILVVADVLHTVATTNWALSGGAWVRDVGFDDGKLITTQDKIKAGTGLSWTVYHQDAFFSDKGVPNPTWVPDISGMYSFQLIVNDGELDSLPTKGSVNIHERGYPLGFVPDLSMIWDYLSDFWSLFDGRDVIETFWSGMSQSLSAILMTAWQMDYGKSIRDIPRLFQRRWLNYRTLHSEDFEGLTLQKIRFMRGPILSGAISGINLDGKTLLLSVDGRVFTTVFVGTSLSAADVALQVNTAMDQALTVEKTADVVAAGGSDYLRLTVESSLVVQLSGTANASLGFSTTEDTENSFSGDLGTRDAGDLKVLNVTDPGVSMLGVSAGSLLRFAGGAAVTVRPVSSTSLAGDVALVDDTDAAWEVCSTVTAPVTDFEKEGVGEGDIAIFEVRETGYHENEEVRCEVLAAKGSVLGFNPRALLEAMSGSVADFDITYMGVLRTRNIPVDKLVTRIPQLQEVILDPPAVFKENAEYQLSTDAAGVRAIRFVAGTFSLDNPPPQDLWAEISYIDNSPAIEGNFGRGVGLTKESFDARTDNLDYLSAVQGLWFSFFHGPSLYNVKLGSQILLGLPFAEERGKIKEIDSMFSAKAMRLLIQDVHDKEVTRSYLVPRNVVWESDGETMLADNPLTGKPYVVGDTVNQFAPISKGVEIKDWVSDPGWWRGWYHQASMLEVDKFFTFLARADVDVFSVTNLIFASAFIKEIRPEYTKAKVVALKRLPPDEIDVTDALTFWGAMHLFDDPICAAKQGSFKYDDVNGSGENLWGWDGPPDGDPLFLYDRRRLCPTMYTSVHMWGDHAGGKMPFDWFWAFDDGGGKDEVPLYGPAPYEGGVGAVKFDTDYPAGTYHRVKKLTGTP